MPLMTDNLSILSKCLGQMLRITRANACIGYAVNDKVVSFSCDLETQVEHFADDLYKELINEIISLQHQLHHVDFTSRSEFTVEPNADNPFGIVISGQHIRNLRVIPICDPLRVYALVIVINASDDRLSSSRTNLKPFVTATANLFSIKQIRNFLPEKKKQAELNITTQNSVSNILNNVYHPVFFFNKDLKILNYNKHGMLLIQQAGIDIKDSFRSLVESLLPTVASGVLEQLYKFEEHQRFNESEWNDVVLKHTAFHSVRADIKLIAIMQGLQGGMTEQSFSHFALMINDNKRNELQSQQRFQALTSLIPLGIVQVDEEFQCVYANDTWSKITSLTMTTSLQNGWTKCFESKDLHRIFPEMQRLNLNNREYSEEIQIISKLNSPKWVRLKSVGLFDELGKINGYILTLDDITNVQVEKEALTHLANIDSLTGLSNRNCFHDRLNLAIARVDRHGEAAVMFLDLDKFKAINDTHGHNAGDSVIQQVARRLIKAVRQEDTVARLGGDEFAIIINDIKTESDVANMAVKIIIEVARSMRVEGVSLKIQCSIGVAFILNSKSTVKSILKKADLALYRAKSLGRDQYCIYTDSLEKESLLTSYLKGSLKKDSPYQFFMEFQPQVDATTNKIVGIEALSRWNNPSKINVTTQEFILQLENNGMINEFFISQLQSLLPLAKRWMDKKLISSSRRLSVNVSAMQLHANDFAKRLLVNINKHNVDCSCLCLEVTETAFMHDPVCASRNLEVLREAGIKVALDDFGSGFTSLSLLRSMPIDSIKIDKEFISDIVNNAVDAKIVQSMIGLSKELNLSVVAEGVENAEIVEWLGLNHCDIQQGYHYFKPMAESQIETCLIKDDSIH